MSEALILPHQFWQEFLPPGTTPSAATFGDTFPVTLADGRQLLLPIRALPGSDSGLASLIINQAGFSVQRELVRLLVERLERFRPEVIIGLPTLGLTVASAVAEALGHSRYLPLGTSRKFWYDDTLSAPVSSVTTPDAKRLYLDPRLLPLLEGRRVILIDDVLSTGKSIVSGLSLLDKIGVRPVAVGALMLQTRRWTTALGPEAPPIVGVFDTPLLVRDGSGWRLAGPWGAGRLQDPRSI